MIVSYGVSDAEYALNEKEFIYSLNRLNVGDHPGADQDDRRSCPGR